ncbi:hypothetical protein F4678DRAFT_478918 [Xylaria arbuscula]|nr:hypothetical protein F4678DRAFT_478918 [Xylaria arbuscula]
MNENSPTPMPVPVAALANNLAEDTKAKNNPKHNTDVETAENTNITPLNPTVTFETDDGVSQVSATRVGPLSALLGGREWVKMTPEERRLFWVSQHNADAFDAAIYSENNRPFRPGDVLFGLPEHMLPPRPTRPATHYNYINPRPRWSQQGHKKGYQAKQNKISGRGVTKQNLGKAVTRAAERKQAELVPSSTRKREGLPRRVRDNPKWLAALDVLDNIEGQARAKRLGKVYREKSSTATKDKAPATVDSASDFKFRF